MASVTHYMGRVADHSPALVMTDLSSAQCTHAHWYRDGWRDGRQKLRCTRCRMGTIVGVRPSRLVKLSILGPNYVAGLSIKQAMKKTGYTYGCVQRIYILLRARASVLCPCGRSASHSGRCRARREKEVKRETPWHVELHALLLTDLSGKHIARAMGITYGTLHSYTNQLYQKLNVHDRVDLMSREIERLKVAASRASPVDKKWDNDDQH